MLKQTKLTKSEWDSIEIPIDADEKHIIRFLSECYNQNDVNVSTSCFRSLIQMLKVEQTLEMDMYLFKHFFDTKPTPNKIKIKKSDKIRIEHADKSSIQNCWESIVLETCKLVKLHPLSNLYKLYKLMQSNVQHKNDQVVRIGQQVFADAVQDIELDNLIYATDFNIEWDDITLYNHQKELFSEFRNPQFETLQDLFLSEPESEPVPLKAHFLFYIAPTGTGKTLTPIALASHFRVIFVCAARHVGLSLARSSLSMNKKIAFAFGCNGTDDIRLHNSAAVIYQVNKRSGAICKVDHSVGTKVEIMISDIVSYKYAMLYMKAFNHAHNIVLFWDEPTISLDAETHELHDAIETLWHQNMVPNVIFSSATLPQLTDLDDVVQSFRAKFCGPNVDVIMKQISSYDMRRSLPLLSTEGYILMPHLLHENYEDMLTLVNYCESNLTLMRYLDLAEILRFLEMVEKNNFIKTEWILKRQFTSMDEITIENLKKHYLRVLSNVKKGCWGSLFLKAKTMRRRMFELEKDHETEVWGVYLSSWDAYTLTDGPTMFLTNDVDKIGKFLIQRSGIPADVLNRISEIMEQNAIIVDKLEKVMAKMENSEDMQQQHANRGDEESVKRKGVAKEKEEQVLNGYQTRLREEELRLQAQLKVVELPDVYVPNKPAHLEFWKRLKKGNSYSSSLGSGIVQSVMKLANVSDSYKLLLLMGIGVFSQTIMNTEYLEIMKELAANQRLYLVVASGDYVYGTNYQFCHGYLSKDLHLTQEKMIQCMGRVGRKVAKQQYSIRLRDDAYAHLLFMPQVNRVEIQNMNRLFSESARKADKVCANTESCTSACADSDTG